MVGGALEQLTVSGPIFEDVPGKQYDFESMSSVLSMFLYVLDEACLKAAVSATYFLSNLVSASCVHHCTSLEEEVDKGMMISVLASQHGDITTDETLCGHFNCCKTVWGADLQPGLLFQDTGLTHCMSSSEEYVPSTCRVTENNGFLEGPDTNVKLDSKEVNNWLVAAKNKDDEDKDEEDEDDDDDDNGEDDDDDADEEGAGDDEEGEEGVEGDEDDEDDDDEGDDGEEDDDDGKEGEEDEDEDGVEGEEEDDEDGVDDEGDEEDEDDEDNEDKDDEVAEPPKKKRK